MLGKPLDFKLVPPPLAISALASVSGHPDWLSLEDIDLPLHQHTLSVAIDECLFKQLITTVPSTRARALALSSSLPHAGDWLNVVPSPHLGLNFHHQEFRCCLRYWLGIPLHSNSYPCPECRSMADPFGDHQVGCGGNGDRRITHHNAMRDVTFSASQSAALAPTKEAPGVIPSSLSRSTDLLLPTWRGGRPAALDVHVISPLQESESSFTRGHTLQAGVQHKLSSSLSACRSTGTDFVPLVAETLGGLAEDTISTISAIGCAAGDRIGLTDSGSFTKQLFRRLAIALLKGRLHRFPTLPPSLDGVA